MSNNGLINLESLQNDIRNFFEAQIEKNNCNVLPEAKSSLMLLDNIMEKNEQDEEIFMTAYLPTFFVIINKLATNETKV